MLWLCLHFPQLALETVFAGCEATEPGPQAVVLDSVIHTANRAARASGVVPGQALATASSLCANLQLRQRDLLREEGALRQLAQWAYHYTPAVSVWSPDSLVLEVGGSLRLFGGLASLLEGLRGELALLRHSCGQAVAATPKAAWLLARAGSAGEAGGDAAGTATARLVEALPATLLPWSRERQQRLRDMGLSRIGQLLALPPGSLARRLGRDAELYLQQLTGARPDPQQALQPPTRFHRTLEFDVPLRDGDWLMFPARRMLLELEVFLRRRQLTVERLEWLLCHESRPDTPVVVSLARPQQSAEPLLELTRLSLSTLCLPAPVQSLALQADMLSPRQDGCSGDLFTERRQAISREALVERLCARIGRHAVFRLRCVEEHVPERATQRCDALAAYAQSHGAGRIITAPRPSLLSPRPRVLSWRAGRLHDRDGELVLLQGPERLVCDWWRQPLQRDYYVARHSAGGVYWIYRDGADGQWFCHGVFA